MYTYSTYFGNSLLLQIAGICTIKKVQVGQFLGCRRQKMLDICRAP